MGTRSVAPMEVMQRIAEAVDAGRMGSVEVGRARLEALWAELSAVADPVPRCVVAHHLADLHEQVEAELTWDRRALAAALAALEADPESRVGEVHVRAFLPSLHLNIADASHRLGDHVSAREHLTHARAHLDQLADDGYGRMIRGGVDRLAAVVAPPT